MYKVANMIYVTSVIYVGMN